MFTFDAHLDLSMNALEWNRDYTRPISEIRQREHSKTDKPDRGRGTVCLPELRKGNIGLVVATQIARYVRLNNPLPGWFSSEQAWAQTQGQLAWYRAMEERGEMVQITNRAELEKHVQLWLNNPPARAPIGYILSLEGADSMVTLKHVERSYAQGLRALGPAHYGPGTYAQGTDATGGIGQRGRDLLREMERLGIILDATHLCDDSFWEALDHFHGRVWASHNNCRALVPHNRQFSDEQIKALIARGAVIGGALDAWMMVPGWIRGKTTPESSGVKLEHLVDHLDHICQLAGNANHIGIGTDLDGGYGREQSPGDLDTIADLQRLPALFAKRGYSQADIEAVMHGNFIRFLRETWK
ncbi:MAG: membrane dipeptidase [Verrucomicrobiota bacterium]